MAEWARRDKSSAGGRAVADPEFAAVDAVVGNQKHVVVDDGQRMGQIELEVRQLAGGPGGIRLPELDAGAIVGAMHRRREHLAAEARALRGLTHHEVVYEEDLLHASDHQRTMNRVFEFLGLVPVEVEAGLARSVSGSTRTGRTSRRATFAWGRMGSTRNGSCALLTS